MYGLILMNDGALCRLAVAVQEQRAEIPSLPVRAEVVEIYLNIYFESGYDVFG